MLWPSRRFVMVALAFGEDPCVIRRILTHPGLAGDEGLPAGLADP